MSEWQNLHCDGKIFPSSQFPHALTWEHNSNPKHGCTCVDSSIPSSIFLPSMPMHVPEHLKIFFKGISVYYHLDYSI